MSDLIRRLREGCPASNDVDCLKERCKAADEIERLQAVVDAARPIADNYTGFAGHIELIQALAALEGGDE
jgi:hypothetical protein